MFGLIFLIAVVLTPQMAAYLTRKVAFKLILKV